MAYNDAGIYYATNSTTSSTTNILQNFAESVSDKLYIIQTVGGETSTLITNTSTTVYAASGLSATITPKFATSKILVLATLPFSVGVDTDNSFGIGWSQADFNLLKGSSTISAFSSGINGVGWTNATEMIFNESLSVSFTDSPSTTSAVTYSLSGKISNRTPTAVARYLRMNYSQSVAAKSSIILMEVVA